MQGHFLISSKNTSVEAFILFADALYGNSHFPRAMHYYKQALDKVTPKTNTSTVETDLFLKIGNCCVKLRDDPTAISWLEKISPTQRTLSTNMQLARLHHSSGAKIASFHYKEVLKQDPYALEAIYALISLGEDPETLATFLDTSISSSIANPDKPLSRTWLGVTALAYHYFTRDELVGQCHTLLEDDQRAAMTFQTITKLDPYHERSMDLYAYMLRRDNSLFELNKLGHSLVRSGAGSRDSPQCWTVLGLYADGTGNRERAAELLDRAIAHGHQRTARTSSPLYDGSLARAYLSRADLLMANKLPDQAVISYRRAHALTGGSLRSCQGLVTSHLALVQFKEAQRYATEATRRWPNSARAQTLMGLILSQAPETRAKARKILSDALTASPTCTDALLALSNLLALDGKLQEALDLLKGHMKLTKSEVVYLQMGEICVQMKNYDDAQGYYNLALTQNPASEIAQKALIRVDMLLKGKDPDAPEAEEEEEEEEEEEGEEIDEEDDDQDMLE